MFCNAEAKPNKSPVLNSQCGVAEIPAAVATAAAMAADIPATAVDTQATAVPIASPPATAALITRASGGSIRQFKIGPKNLEGPCSLT